MQLRSVEPRSCRLTDSAYVPYQRLRAARRIVQREPAGTYPELEPPIREHAGCCGVIGHHHGMTSVVGKHVSRQAKDRCRIGCCHTSRYRRHVTYQMWSRITGVLEPGASTLRAVDPGSP